MHLAKRTARRGGYDCGSCSHRKLGDFGCHSSNIRWKATWVFGFWVLSLVAFTWASTQTAAELCQELTTKLLQSEGRSEEESLAPKELEQAQTSTSLPGQNYLFAQTLYGRHSFHETNKAIGATGGAVVPVLFPLPGDTDLGDQGIEARVSGAVMVHEVCN